MKLCNSCKSLFPDHLISRMAMGARKKNDRETEMTYSPMCPICALDARNKAHGLPEGTPFAEGSIAKQMFDEAMDYLNTGPGEYSEERKP
jgi:hypothetical protein